MMQNRNLCASLTTTQSLAKVGLLHHVFKKHHAGMEFSSSRGLRTADPAETIDGMITISKDQLPQNFLSYIAFRTAFLDTMERIVWTLQFDTLDDDRFGYLAEVPFLRSVPPHVQLDLLATAWWKHTSETSYPADLVDEAIVYAACELSAKIAEEDPSLLKRYLQKGPMPVNIVIDQHLAAELRDLHLKLSNEGDFLLIGQFSDLPPEDARRLKEKFQFSPQRAESMFEVLSRWHIAPNFQSRAELLLTREEAKHSFEAMQTKMTASWLSS